MRRTLVTGLGVAVSVGLFLFMQSVNSAQVQDKDRAAFKAATDREVIDGDVKRAIEQYKKIAESTKDRGLAAQALLRLANAQDRLGDKESQKTYQRIVTEFPDQHDAVEAARTRLITRDSVSLSSPSGSAQGPRARRVAGAVVDGSLSADGRYMAFADQTGGSPNLAIRNLLTGETRSLTTNASPSGWVGNVIISPDAAFVAYRWEGGSDESTRVIRADGTGMRVLTRQPYGEELAAWSPDGRWIAAVRRNYKDMSVQLVLLSTSDAEVKQLKSMPWAFPEVGGVSPDGRFLVYAISDDSGQSSVFALATDGSRETPLVADATGNRAPRWTPDGKYVVFVSDRNQPAELWRLRVTDGRAQSEPELVHEGRMDPASVGITSDGSFYYTVRNGAVGAYLADFDPVTLKASRVEPVSNPANGTANPELSPDGRFVAFFRRRPQGWSLVIRTLATGAEKEFREVPLRCCAYRILWRPDSRSILGVANSPSASRVETIVSMDRETGEIRTVFQRSGLIWRTMALSPDGRSLFYTAIEAIADDGPGDQKRLRLVKRDLTSGQEVDVHSTESQGLGYFGLTVSQDGKWLAFALNVGVSERTLMIMPATGGTPVEIERWPDRVTLPYGGAMAWTPDSRHLIVTARCGSNDSYQLCSMSRDGGPLRPVANNVQTVTTRMLSADGRRLAFTGSSESYELWMIPGLFAENSVLVR